jgi:hypothetical protein
MNAKQKELTYYAIAAFVLTLLFAAWDLTGSPNRDNATKYSPIFAPPNLGPYAKRELASSVFWSWFGIAVIYTGLSFAFRHPKLPPKTQSDEGVVATS